MRAAVALAVAVISGGGAAAQPGDQPPPRTTLVERGVRLWAVAVTPDGKALVTVTGEERALRARDLASGKDRAWEGSVTGVGVVAVSPDGAMVAAGRTDGSVRLIDLATGKERAGFRVQREGYNDLVFSPDGKTLAAIDGDHVVTLWGVPSGKVIGRLRHEPVDDKKWQVGLADIAFAPDGKTLYSLCVGANSRGGLTVWDVGTARPRQVVYPTRRTGMMALSPDGKRLATGDSFNYFVTLWDTADELRVATDLRIQGGHCQGLRFDPTSRVLATMTHARAQGPVAVALWDAAARRELRAWSLADFWLADMVLFTADGKSLLTGGQLQGLYRWDLAAPP